MTTICTSCGASIPSSLSIYKCHQCVNHYVCELCETKDHKRASAAFHTLEKIQVSNVQLTAAPTSNISSESVDNSDSQTKFIRLCDHCYRVLVMDHDPTFQYQQCPSGFGVCAQCLPLMNTEHPSVYIFSKQSLSHWAKVAHDMYHLDIKCDGCSRTGFNRKRYQCEECPPTYDLCEDCFGEKHTHYKLKYIQNPLLHSNNQGLLAHRTLALAQINGQNNINWRDPLTGWTKSDAELVSQQAKLERENYHNRLQQIQKKNDERAKEEYRHARQALAVVAEPEKISRAG